jgi:allene oxide cyclase-like protein
MHRTPTLIAAAAAIAAVAAASALPASGQDGSSTLEVVLKESKRDTKFIDLPPKGESLGDRLVLSSTARRDGKVVGRTEAECVLQDKTYEAFSCVGNLLLADGKITFQGSQLNKAIPGALPKPKSETYAVTGGTGAYAGAAGSLTLSGPEKAERARIAFTR